MIVATTIRSRWDRPLLYMEVNSRLFHVNLLVILGFGLLSFCGNSTSCCHWSFLFRLDMLDIGMKHITAVGFNRLIDRIESWLSFLAFWRWRSPSLSLDTPFFLAPLIYLYVINGLMDLSDKSLIVLNFAAFSFANFRGRVWSVHSGKDLLLELFLPLNDIFELQNLGFKLFDSLILLLRLLNLHFTSFTFFFFVKQKKNLALRLGLRSDI